MTSAPTLPFNVLASGSPEAWIADLGPRLGAGSAFVVTSTPPPLGALVELRLLPDGDGPPLLVATGRVTWRYLRGMVPPERDEGFGLIFDRPPVHVPELAPALAAHPAPRYAPPGSQLPPFHVDDAQLEQVAAARAARQTPRPEEPAGPPSGADPAEAAVLPPGPPEPAVEAASETAPPVEPAPGVEPEAGPDGGAAVGPEVGPAGGLELATGSHPETAAPATSAPAPGVEDAGLPPAGGPTEPGPALGDDDDATLTAEPPPSLGPEEPTEPPGPVDTAAPLAAEGEGPSPRPLPAPPAAVDQGAPEPLSAMSFLVRPLRPGEAELHEIERFGWPASGTSRPSDPDRYVALEESWARGEVVVWRRGDTELPDEFDTSEPVGGGFELENTDPGRLSRMVKAAIDDPELEAVGGGEGRAALGDPGTIDDALRTAEDFQAVAPSAPPAARNDLVADDDADEAPTDISLSRPAGEDEGNVTTQALSTEPVDALAFDEPTEEAPLDEIGAAEELLPPPRAPAPGPMETTGKHAPSPVAPAAGGRSPKPELRVDEGPRSSWASSAASPTSTSGAVAAPTGAEPLLPGPKAPAPAPMESTGKHLPSPSTSPPPKPVAPAPAATSSPALAGPSASGSRLAAAAEAAVLDATISLSLPGAPLEVVFERGASLPASIQREVGTGGEDHVEVAVYEAHPGRNRALLGIARWETDPGVVLTLTVTVHGDSVEVDPGLQELGRHRFARTGRIKPAPRRARGSSAEDDGLIGKLKKLFGG